MARNTIRLKDGDESVKLFGFSFVVDLDWEFSADLDLAALCVDENGEETTLVCNENEGKRAAAPWVHLAHSSEGDGRTKGRREHLVITNAAEHGSIYFFIWDHNASKGGLAADFAKSPDSYRLSITDRRNKRIELGPVRGSENNCILVGRMVLSTVTAMNEATRMEGSTKRMEALRNMAGIQSEVTL